MPRLLLVSTLPNWVALATEAAGRLGAAIDVVPDVHAALVRMLRPDHVYTHVLASGPLRSREVDTLAGMLDEVTLKATPLVILGGGGGGINTVESVVEPDMDALLRALSDRPAPAPATELTPEELTAALHNGGLRMRFQPIVRATDLQPIGLEALARVHTRERGIMHPKDFIPATIASGRERLLTSIAAARTFLELSCPVGDLQLFVTLNVPMVSFLHPTALRRAVEMCALAGVAHKRVMVEVLESLTAPDMVLLGRALDTWRAAGFLTAIDDAGPELPHWREMMELPFDAVKLDGTLISDPGSQALLESIVGAAKARSRFTILEGIEDEACLERAKPLEVDALQGFLFARPLPAMALPLWLDAWAKRDEAARAAAA